MRLRCDSLWQFQSAKSGISSYSAIHNTVRFPKTTLKVSEKINCRSWSLETEDRRNIFDRVVAAQRVLNNFGGAPAKIKKIYFFKRRRARSIFKKRLNNYISFEIVSPLSLVSWMELICLLVNFSALIRRTYRLQVGLFLKKSSSIRFIAVNPTILRGFLGNETVAHHPQLLVGLCSSQPNSLINTAWLWKKINETS